MESWNTPHTPMRTRILLLVRDKFGGVCPANYLGVAELLGANERTVSVRIADLVKSGLLVRTPFGLAIPK